MPHGHAARGWDVKRWRYRFFATAGKIISRARRTRLLIPDKAPEACRIGNLRKVIAELAERFRGTAALPA